MTPVPSAADGVSVTPSGTTFNNSAWVELIASTSAAALLLSIIVRQGTDADFEIDIGTGAAGAETVRATVSARTNRVIGTTGFTAALNLALPIDNIANAARIACRMRKAGTVTTAWNISILIAYKPISGVLPSTTNVSKVLPSAAAHLSVSSGAGAYVNGAWVQLTASTAAAWILAAISANSRGQYEIDIGAGTAGAEVVKTTIRDEANSTSTGAHFFIPFPTPLDNIGSGVRVAVRMRNSDGAALTGTVSVTYFEKPV